MGSDGRWRSGVQRSGSVANFSVLRDFIYSAHGSRFASRLRIRLVSLLEANIANTVIQLKGAFVSKKQGGIVASQDVSSDQDQERKVRNNIQGVRSNCGPRGDFNSGYLVRRIDEPAILHSRTSDSDDVWRRILERLIRGPAHEKRIHRRAHHRDWRSGVY